MSRLPRPGLRLLAALGLLYIVYTAGPIAVWAGAKFYAQAPDEASATSQASAPESEAAPAESGAGQPPVPAESLLPNFLEGTSLPAGEEEPVFTLYDVATGQVLTVPEEEFLPAAIACEMDLSSPREALKAQAVAIYTYYTRQKGSGQAQGADFACDTENWLVYVPQSAMQARWGEHYDENLALLQAVSQEVQGQLLTWQGEPALTPYFAISPGSTQAAADVWSPDAAEEYPYLQAVVSPGDPFSDGYLSTRTFTEDAFKETAAAYFTSSPLDFSGPAEGWLTEIEAAPGGLVKTARLGGVEVSGGDMRTAFSLRSACFTLSAADGELTFTVRGWGHGVGMSQAGAVFMAEQGAGYQEILAHYYPGLTLISSR